jgi:hypothetical protein
MPSAISHCNDSKHICPACSVFGYLGGKGRLKFTSFRPLKDVTPQNYSIPQLQTPFKDYGRPKAGNERLYYGDFLEMHGAEIGNMDKRQFFDKKEMEREGYPQFYGRKFYKNGDTVIKDPKKCVRWVKYECLESGTTLQGTVGFEGLTTAELCSLLFTLGIGWEKSIVHKIGYAKPAFFGSVKIDVAGNVPTQYRSDVEASSLRGKYQSIISSYRNFEKVIPDLSKFVIDYYDKNQPSSDVKKSIENLSVVWSKDNIISKPVWVGAEGGY